MKFVKTFNEFLKEGMFVDPMDEASSKYKPVAACVPFTLDNGAQCTSVVTLENGMGSRCHIANDDDCYVVCVGDDENGYSWTTHISSDVFEVLRQLPPPDEDLKNALGLSQI